MNKYCGDKAYFLDYNREAETHEKYSDKKKIAAVRIFCPPLKTNALKIKQGIEVISGVHTRVYRSICTPVL